MNTEEKQKAVRWMGWDVNFTKVSNIKYTNCWMYKKRKDGISLYLSQFNPDAPDSPHSVWVKIWERMTEKEKIKYLASLLDEWAKNQGETVYNSNWFFNTASPEIRTDAWLKAIGVRK